MDDYRRIRMTGRPRNLRFNRGIQRFANQIKAAVKKSITRFSSITKNEFVVTGLTSTPIFGIRG